MRRTGYANVVATLALIVALGGTSYAAVKITGKDVKNESLTGKDVKNESLTGKDVKNESLTGQDLKKQSVPLDRLSGSLPTQLDPAQFVPAAGPYTVSAGSSGWQSFNPDLRRSNVFGGWTTWSNDDGATLLFDPVLPTIIAGRSMRLLAVTLCWDATQDVVINDVIITSWREDAAANVTDVVEIEDPSDHTEKTCTRYAFGQPVSLVASSRVGLRLSTGWTLAGSHIKTGGVTLELDRA